MLPIPSISEDIEIDNNTVLITGWSGNITTFNVGQGYKNKFSVYHNDNNPSRKVTIYLRIKYKN